MVFISTNSAILLFLKLLRTRLVLFVDRMIFFSALHSQRNVTVQNGSFVFLPNLTNRIVVVATSQSKHRLRSCFYLIERRNVCVDDGGPLTLSELPTVLMEPQST